MNAQEMWDKYQKAMGLKETEYDAWAFGEKADSLAALVLQGVKTATSSAFDLYALEGEEIPKAGDISVVLDGREEAVCIIENLEVTVLPYDEVTEEMAVMEGEDDKSLLMWRKVHERFFREDMGEAGLCFHEKMMVVFEKFRVVWPEKKE